MTYVSSASGVLGTVDAAKDSELNKVHFPVAFHPFDSSAVAPYRLFESEELLRFLASSAVASSGCVFGFAGEVLGDGFTLSCLSCDALVGPSDVPGACSLSTMRSSSSSVGGPNFSVKKQDGSCVQKKECLVGLCRALLDPQFRMGFSPRTNGQTLQCALELARRDQISRQKEKAKYQKKTQTQLRSLP